MAFRSHLSYEAIYVVNCQKVASKSHFHVDSYEKRMKKQFFGAKYISFHKLNSLRSKTFMNLSQTCLDTLTFPHNFDIPTLL